MSDRVDAIFSRYDNDSPGCAVGVSKKGRVLVAKGYGRANLEYEVPITRDTPFYIASMSKQFTASAVGLLAIEEQLSLSDSVRKYVRELPAYANHMTIDHLVHHTDGLRDYFTLLYFAGRGYQDELRPEEIVELISRQDKTNFPPGTQFLYANSGYAMLPRVVEAVAKVKLAEFAQKRIFEPLGMTSTRYVPNFRSLIRGRAEGYTPSTEGWQSPRSRFAEVGPSGVVSTVTDLLIWIDALRTSKLGQEATDQALSKGILDGGDVVNYGFGLFIDEYRGLEIVHHGGARPGYASNLIYAPSLDAGVVVLCNRSDVDAETTSHAVLEVVAAKALEPQAQTTVNSASYVGLVGTYAFSPTALLTVTREGDRLFAQATYEGRYEIFPLSRDEFFYKVADLRISFRRDDAGQAASLVLHQNGLNTPAMRVAETAQNTAHLQQFTGEYRSEDVGATYLIYEKDEALRGKVGYEDIELSALGGDAFAAPGATLEFERDLDGEVSKFFMSGQRAIRVEFLKL